MIDEVERVRIIKARKHGFDCCLDSEEMFSRLLSEMADTRLIPAL